MTRRRLVLSMLIGCTLCSPIGLEAEPLVLHDTGRTIAIDTYLAPITPKGPSSAKAPPPPSLRAAGYGLPIDTPSMTPGRVNQRPLPALRGKMAGANPLFLIGADRWSLQWLQRNRQRLADIHAIGMVISVTAKGDLDILREAAGDLQLMPASGEAIAQQLGLKHYPVLIAPPGIVYQ
ncbi:MAG: integrating conjugative element protein [Geminicoccaceae bacterium]